MNKPFIAVVAFAIALTVPLAASASNVTVSIQNLEAHPITRVTENICGTTTPNPPSSIAALSTFVYVDTNCSTQVNSGHITYQNSSPISAGSCAFNYSSIYTLQAGGTYAWVFASSAIQSSDATCTSKITALNPTTGDFAVTFTMKNIY